MAVHRALKRAYDDPEVYEAIQEYRIVRMFGVSDNGDLQGFLDEARWSS